MSALLVYAAVLGSLLAFYTGYSKKTKALDLNQVLDVVLVRGGLDATLVQLNKIVSLAGLTLLGALFLPGVDALAAPEELLSYTLWSLWLHAAYSVYKYYNGPNIPALSTWPRVVSEARSNSPKARVSAQKKLSIVLAGGAQLILLGWFTGHVGFEVASGTLAAALGLLHFVLMELDFKGNLPVRPWGHIATASSLAGVVIGALRTAGVL